MTEVPEHTRMHSNYTHTHTSYVCIIQWLAVKEGGNRMQGREARCL